jgi:pre-mRNA-processing factor 17
VDDADEDEDDAAIAEQAKTDAFGLASAAPATAAKVSTKVAVTAAPDVLREDPNVMSNAIITRATDQVSFQAIALSLHSPGRECECHL